jgi:hypothetical protein
MYLINILNNLYYKYNLLISYLGLSKSEILIFLDYIEEPRVGLTVGFSKLDILISLVDGPVLL